MAYVKNKVARARRLQSYALTPTLPETPGLGFGQSHGFLDLPNVYPHCSFKFVA